MLIYNKATTCCSSLLHSGVTDTKKQPYINTEVDLPLVVSMYGHLVTNKFYLLTRCSFHCTSYLIELSLPMITNYLPTFCLTRLRSGRFSLKATLIRLMCLQLGHFITKHPFVPFSISHTRQLQIGQYIFT